MERMKDGDIISFNGTVYKYCTGGTCLQCSLHNTRLCDHLKCFNGEHFEILKNAYVLEMPSEEELEMIAELEYPTGTDDYLRAKGIKLAQAAFNGGVNWLKSKIIK